MTSRSAREFRRNNPVLFTDSENSENSDENESENDENESENEDSESTSDEVEVKDLKFELQDKEHKATGRPSKLRGNNNRRPRAENIPEEAFESPRKLFHQLYGYKARDRNRTKIFLPINMLFIV